MGKEAKLKAVRRLLRSRDGRAPVPLNRLGRRCLEIARGTPYPRPPSVYAGHRPGGYGPACVDGARSAVVMAATPAGRGPVEVGEA
jgi:hypothetical protein